MLFELVDPLLLEGLELVELAAEIDADDTLRNKWLLSNETYVGNNCCSSDNKTSLCKIWRKSMRRIHKYFYLKIDNSIY